MGQCVEGLASIRPLVPESGRESHSGVLGQALGLTGRCPCHAFDLTTAPLHRDVREYDE